MAEKQQSSHVGFLRRSGIFLILNLLYSVFELGFNGVSVRLPGDGYSTFWALQKIFFIITTPLIGIQLVISKEVASYGVLGAYGKCRNFVRRTFVYTLFGALIIIVLGLLVSPFIRDFLRIDSTVPVFFMLIVIGVYFPLPILYGTIQGLKRFYTLGLMQACWGFLRFIFAFIIVCVMAGGLNKLLTGIIAATAVTAMLSWIPARPIFRYPGDDIDRHEILHAYGLIFPVILMVFCVMVMKNADVVFAKRFSDSAPANAYTTAALVGSAFFTLSGIFMVMFPMVSEEKTRGGNPIIFLLKSCGFVTVLSFIGIVVAWVKPDVLMYIITVGKYVPGAEPLIQLISVAVPPLSLIFVMSNYLLAKHKTRFLLILFGGMILQVLFIVLNHETPFKMLTGIIIANTLTLVGMLLYILVEHRDFVKTAPDGGKATL